MKRWAKYLLAAIALLGGGYALGRYAAPDKVVLREDTEAREQVRKLTEQLESLRQHTKKQRVIVVQKDGTKTITENEDTLIDRNTGTRETDNSIRDERKKSESETTRVRPNWRVSLLGGAQLQLDPLGASPLLGAHVERRLAGPFSVGLWSIVRPNPMQVSGGLSLGVEF